MLASALLLRATDPLARSFILPSVKRKGKEGRRAREKEKEQSPLHQYAGEGDFFPKFFADSAVLDLEFFLGYNIYIIYI